MMFSAFNPQECSSDQNFPSISDPWDVPPKGKNISHPSPVPLDPSHELEGSPIRKAMMPQGVPNALRLTAHITTQQSSTAQCAIMILLEDQLKLAHHINKHLRDEVQGAIALLEFASL